MYGGRASSELAFSKALLSGLEMARKKLRCSFTGLDGRDISEDVRVNLVERSPGNQPRSYRFVINFKGLPRCTIAINSTTLKYSLMAFM